MDDDPVPVSRAVNSGTARLLPDVDRPRGWLLTVDGAPQSYVDLADPSYLEFEYVRRLAYMVDLAVPEGPLDVLHLGGGGLTLPRYTAAARPGSRQLVVESDRALLTLVLRQLPVPVPPGPDLTCRVADAREALERAPADSADLVVSDVYGGTRVPASMTTLSCARAAARVLRPGGVWAANLADAAPFPFLGSQLATFGAVFAEMCVLAEPSVLRGRRFGNAVLLASASPLPLAALARRAAADPFPARVAYGTELRRLAAGAVPVEDRAAVPSPRPPEGSFGIG